MKLTKKPVPVTNKEFFVFLGASALFGFFSAIFKPWSVGFYIQWVVWLIIIILMIRYMRKKRRKFDENDK